MKTIKGSITSSKSISLSKAASFLHKFLSSETGASNTVSIYLTRTSSVFDELVQLHRELKSQKVDPRTSSQKVEQLSSLDRHLREKEIAFDDELRINSREIKKKKKKNKHNEFLKVGDELGVSLKEQVKSEECFKSLNDIESGGFTKRKKNKQKENSIPEKEEYENSKGQDEIVKAKNEKTNGDNGERRKRKKFDGKIEGEEHQEKKRKMTSKG